MDSINKKLGIMEYLFEKIDGELEGNMMTYVADLQFGTDEQVKSDPEFIYKNNQEYRSKLKECHETLYAIRKYMNDLDEKLFEISQELQLIKE